MRTRSLFSLALILAVAAVGLGSCKGGDEDNKIVIWAYDYYIDAAKLAVQLYKGSHPDVEFEIVELGQDDLVQKLRIALAGDSSKALPDIVCEEDYNLKGYLEFYGDSFVDLTPFVDPSLYVGFKVENVTYDGKIWGVPYDTGVAAWFYRADILEEAGFSEEDLSCITWDRFLEIGGVVKEKTGKYIIPLAPEGNIEGRIILQSTGRWYYDREGNLDIEDNQVLVDMSETIKKLFLSDAVYKVASWDDIVAAFYNGTAAGVMGGAWWAPVIAENEEQHGLWRVTEIPRMEGDDSYTNYSNCGGCSWLVLNKPNQELAVDFLFATLASSDVIADRMIETHLVVPALITGKDGPVAKRGSAYFGGQNLCETMAGWSQNVPYVNYSSHSYEIAYAHGELFPDYLRGRTTVSEMLALLKEQAKAIVNK